MDDEIYSLVKGNESKVSFNTRTPIRDASMNVVTVNSNGVRLGRQFWCRCSFILQTSPPWCHASKKNPAISSLHMPHVALFWLVLFIPFHLKLFISKDKTLICLITRTFYLPDKRWSFLTFYFLEVHGIWNEARKRVYCSYVQLLELRWKRTTHPPMPKWFASRFIRNC